VEIQVDSGMGRTGLLLDEAEELVATIASHPQLIVEGVYTHFSTADEPDLAFARRQLTLFTGLVDRLKARALPIRGYHAANSAAIFRLPGAHFDRVRPGLAIYGYWGGPDNERPDSLIPSMRVVSRLACIRSMPKDHPIGYGRTFITGRPSRIGIVPLGYADGYRRLFSGDAWMTLPPTRGRDRTIVPVVGRVSMDLVTVDLTDAGDVREGDPVIIVDDHPESPNSVESLARRIDTIPYEITTLIGPRVRRIAIGQPAH
jgi:alanine racemase